MIIGGVIALCVLLFVLALLAPRLSRGPERASLKAFGTGARGAGKAPGPLGRLLSKPFRSGAKASSKSASKGRKARGKLPL